MAERPLLLFEIKLACLLQRKLYVEWIEIEIKHNREKKPFFEIKLTN